MINLIKASALLFACLFTFFNCKKEVNSSLNYHIAGGFNCDLVASEPLIFDPVDLEFDEKGQVFVLEMPGYPLEKEQSRIIHLVDSDGDGKYDDREIYAENLNMASSILPYKKGFLVASPPYLLHVQDLDGNKKAEKIDTLVGGFSKGNLQHNYNGLQFGLDGWLYAANGGNSGEPFWWPNSKEKIDLQGKDFRINIQKKIIERTGESAGGFGITMDEYGHIFGTHNMEHVSQLAYSEQYHKDIHLLERHNLNNISDHEEAGTSRIYPLGEQESRVNHPEQSGYFSGGCGICYYGGGAFGAEYKNSIWVNDVVLNLVHVDKLTENGTLLKASRIINNKEIWANSDRASRPVNMSVGPDGSIYLIDMYRKVIEHPEWIPDELEEKMDLNTGKEKGRIYKISKQESDFFTVEKNNLEAALNHPNQWVRNTTQRILLEDIISDNQIIILNKLLISEEPLARLHAMWILSQQSKLQEKSLKTLLKDEIAGIRENALKIAEIQIPNVRFSNEIISLLNDQNQRVRLQAGLSLSKISKNTNEIDSNRVIKSIVESCKKPLDKWNIAALTTAAKPFLISILQTLPPSTNENLYVSLAGNVPSESLEIFLKLLQKLENKSNLVANMIEQQANNSSKVHLSKAAQNSIAYLEKNQNPSILKACNILRMRQGLAESPYFKKLSQLALEKISDNNLPENERLTQLTLIETMPYKQKQNVLFNCLNNIEPLTIQLAALKQLYNHNEDPMIGQKLLDIWPNLGPIARKSAGDILLYTEHYNSVLLTGLEQNKINIGEMNFDLERRRQLLWWNKNKSINKRAEALFKDSGVFTRKQAIAQMQPALALKGNMENGAKVFLNTCSSCHQFGKIGNEVGPSLTEISRKSKAANLHDIVDPNSAADTKYISHQLETMGGKVIIGIVYQENDEFIEMKQMGAISSKIPKKDIRNLKSLGKSYMIEGLETGLTHQNMADLLTYLQDFKN